MRELMGVVARSFVVIVVDGGVEIGTGDCSGLYLRIEAGRADASDGPGVRNYFEEAVYSGVNIVNGFGETAGSAGRASGVDRLRSPERRGRKNHPGAWTLEACDAWLGGNRQTFFC
jgi:hypothetical protein